MKKLNIGLVGFGTVGQGIYKVIGKAKNAHARIARICVAHPEKKRPDDVASAMPLITGNYDELLADPEINLIVEVIDNPDDSYEIVTKALKKGIPVVSGNKIMIARNLPELIDLQREKGVPFLYDASSCGSIPVIRNLEEYYDNDLLLEVKGILNGSSNYILSRVFDHGDKYEDALKMAQELGFAESDPTFDIEGFDALFKLIIITVHALGVYVSPDDVFIYGISKISDFDIRWAREKRAKIKLVAQVVKISEERFTMFVMPEFVEKHKYIYSVDDEYNGVVIRGECYDRQFMFGKGAGSLPTASSILSDVMAIRRDYRYEYKKMSYLDKAEYTTDVMLKVYVRYRQTDIPALLPFSKISEKYTSEQDNYVVGEINLADLIAKRDLLNAEDVFIINIPRFFIDRD
ncbi:MAG: homoserine dehydrogenase [Muribaculaceae bacterium]|nr:homoserine dehydrogenase [Muribaculaceae bacterium]